MAARVHNETSKSRGDMLQLDFDHLQVQRLRQLGRRVSYKKGEIILRPTDEAESIYFIETGLVKTYATDEHGEQYLHVIYGEDEIFPLAWIIGKEGLDVIYEALTDCEIIRLPQKIFLEAIRSEVDISFSVLNKILRQFVVFAARVDNLEYKTARQRLAYRLILLGQRFGKRDQNGGIVLPSMTHHDIASSINLARESVSRELSRFERLNLIDGQGGRLVILSRAGLRKQIGSDAHSLFIDDESYPAWLPT